MEPPGLVRIPTGMEYVYIYRNNNAAFILNQVQPFHFLKGMLLLVGGTSQEGTSAKTNALDISRAQKVSTVLRMFGIWGEFIWDIFKILLFSGISDAFLHMNPSIQSGTRFWVEYG